MSASRDESVYVDPLLPLCPEDWVDEGLVKDLVRVNAKEAEAQVIAQSMCNSLRTMALALQAKVGGFRAWILFYFRYAVSYSCCAPVVARGGRRRRRGRWVRGRGIVRSRRHSVSGQPETLPAALQRDVC